MSHRKRKTIILLVFLVALIVMVIWTAWGNTALMINEITITSDKIPQSFLGYRIAQISDLHNTEFGDDNVKLIEKLKECKPDIIVFTGDLVDANHTNIDISIAFAEKAIQIAPCYFVTGNHEARMDKSKYNELLDRLADTGVTVLQNESVILEKDHERITLLGVQDPSFQADRLFDEDSAVMNSTLAELMKGANGYTVLLSHRPELFDTYVLNKVDLVLSGHAHGGQFRLPFVGGIVAPDQGLFPKYDAGLYQENGTSMVVSRGLGNSIIPFRINNRPEIVVVELSR